MGELFIVFRVRRKKGLKYLTHFSTSDGVRQFLDGKKDSAGHRYLVVRGQIRGNFARSAHATI